MKTVSEWECFFCSKSSADKEIICKYVSLVKAQIGNGQPVILDFEHLHLLLGRSSGYLASAIHAGNFHWRSFTIPKRSGGKREITVPYGSLMLVQRWIYDNILSKVKVSGFCHGFVKGKSVITNTRWHVKQKEILKIDLKDFFPSIGINRIVAVFQKLGYSKDVSFYLARLCTYNDLLPQGAPTSPCLSNIVALKLDSRISSLAKAYGYRYTRYADDMTFSGWEIKTDFIWTLNRIITEEGFVMNHDKTRLYRDGHKRVVTGINVTDRLSVPRSFKRDLKKDFHFIRKYGLIDHIQKSKIRKKHYLLSVIGRFNFWLMVEPKDKFATKALAYLQGLAKAGMADW